MNDKRFSIAAFLVLLALASAAHGDAYRFEMVIFERPNAVTNEVSVEEPGEMDLGLSRGRLDALAVGGDRLGGQQQGTHGLSGLAQAGDQARADESSGAGHERGPSVEWRGHGVPSNPATTARSMAPASSASMCDLATARMPRWLLIHRRPRPSSRI